MRIQNATSRGWRARAAAVVAAYLRACTVPDACATSPLAPVPDAALTATRVDAPGHPDVRPGGS
ncbi:hypothetical protein [Streptomyces sp. NBC_01363]|uniref:hypothetical protein n=1 Tax=Streptomyces sp. NBC_01363 TaxID=2903840 RepID=UPI00225197E1|nr:hypothetical protein [Streptomyces sp. NBC_01363]MCX4736407.1 hypothetical protein [Streptomyces sp. NBC_01363]